MKDKWRMLGASLCAAAMLTSCGPQTTPPGESTATTSPTETDAPDANPAYTLIENGVCRYAVVRPEKADKTTMDAAVAIYQQLAKVSTSQVTLTTDWIKHGAEHDSGTLEILVGGTGYAESAEAAARLAYGEYGVLAVGNKLCVVGVSPECLQSAGALLATVIENRFVPDDGGGSLVVGEEYLKPVRKSGWSTALPAFAGAEYRGTFDCNDNVYKHFFTGVSAEAYDAWCDALTGAGAVLGEAWTIAHNRFRTGSFDNQQMLISFYPDAGEVGVAMGRNMPTLPEMPKESYTPVQPLLTQLAQPNQGWDGDMGYLLRLEDSSFIIIDGGFNGGDGGEAEALYQTMREQNLRADGRLIVRAWVITHGHNDHYNVLATFRQSHAADVTVEALLYNPMAPFYQALSDTPTCWDARAAVNNFTGCQYVKIMAGHVIEYPGCKIEVLLSADDTYRMDVWSMNNSSAILRITMGGQVFLVLADIEAGTGHLVELWGDALKADIVQMAHHGYHGGSIALYDLVQPTVVLWPAGQAAYQRWRTGIDINRHLVSLPCVKEVINSGEGQRTLALPYTPEA